MDNAGRSSKEKTGNRKYHLTEGDKILQDLADETGGRSFYPYHVDDLDQSFQDIGEELRNQYSLAYNATNHSVDGRYHKIRPKRPIIRVTRFAGVATMHGRTRTATRNRQWSNSGVDPPYISPPATTFPSTLC